MCEATKLMEEAIKLKERYHELKRKNQQKQSIADKKTQDLLHRIELGTFHASQGYNLCKQLQQARRDRRSAQDEVRKLTEIKSLFDFDEHHINKKLVAQKKGLDGREYKPRILKDIF